MTTDARASLQTQVELRLLLCLCGVVIAAGCDRGSTSFGSPTGPNPPAPVTANLSGRVTEILASSVLPIDGALLTIADGGNAGKTATTNANGEYSFTTLRPEAFSVTVSASGYLTTAFPIDLRSDATRDFPLSPSTPRTPFGAGVFRVGTEILAGRYFSDPPQSGCYWERQRGSGGIIADIIANRFVTYDGMQYIVDILSSDVAFKTDAKCGAWFDSPRHGAQSSIPPGIWLVGMQIQPGTYQTSSGANCYWERLRHFQYQGVSGVIANSFSGAAKSQTVTIAGSDAGFSSDGNCGTWTRASTLSALSSDAAATQSVADIERHRALYEQAVGERRGRFGR